MMIWLNHVVDDGALLGLLFAGLWACAVIVAWVIINTVLHRRR